MTPRPPLFTRKPSRHRAGQGEWFNDLDVVGDTDYAIDIRLRLNLWREVTTAVAEPVSLQLPFVAPDIVYNIVTASGGLR